MKRKTDEELQEIKAMLIAKQSLDEIAEKLGCTRQAVSDLASRHFGGIRVLRSYRCAAPKNGFIDHMGERFYWSEPHSEFRSASSSKLKRLKYILYEDRYGKCPRNLSVKCWNQKKKDVRGDNLVLFPKGLHFYEMDIPKILSIRRERRELNSSYAYLSKKYKTPIMSVYRMCNSDKYDWLEFCPVK